MSIKPIETRYAGCRFRSRLEARYAVLFDKLGISWQYEPQGYVVGPDHDRRPYLPDFYLEDRDVWVEVKGDRATADLRLLAYAASATYGLPKAVGAWRLLLLGNLPRVDRGWEVWHHAMVSHTREDGWEGGKPGMLSQHPVWFNGDVIEAGYQGVKVDAKTDLASGWVAPGLVVGSEDDDFASMGTDPETNDHPDFWRFDAQVHRGETLWPAEWVAYTAARSARFEHGEAS